LDSASITTDIKMVSAATENPLNVLHVHACLVPRNYFYLFLHRQEILCASDYIRQSQKIYCTPLRSILTLWHYKGINEAALFAP